MVVEVEVMEAVIGRVRVSPVLVTCPKRSGEEKFEVDLQREFFVHAGVGDGCQ